MRTRARKFLKDESGAVTVDWVVLTAAVLGINVFGIMAMIEDGLEVSGNAILSAVMETTDNP